MSKHSAINVNHATATPSSRLVQETPDILPLHTNAAAFLFRGRRMVPAQKGQKAVPGIMGARRFFWLVGKMEIGIKGDDPYADWHFHNVDRAIAKARRQLDEFASTLRAMTPPTRAEKGITRPKKPHRVEYIRPGILGYQLMTLLEQVDDLLLDVIVLGHRGIITLDKKTALLKSLESTFRRVLHTSLHYTFTGVTRADFATRNLEAGHIGTKALERAISEMGECPQHYVEREAFSKYAPNPTKAQDGPGDREAQIHGVLSPTSTSVNDGGDDLRDALMVTPDASEGDNSPSDSDSDNDGDTAASA